MSNSDLLPGCPCGLIIQRQWIDKILSGEKVAQQSLVDMILVTLISTQFFNPMWNQCLLIGTNSAVDSMRFGSYAHPEQDLWAPPLGFVTTEHNWFLELVSSRIALQSHCLALRNSQTSMGSMTLTSCR